jgi:Tol biopolymer transport system component
VAWLDDSLLAFLYVPMEVEEALDYVGLWEQRVILYDLGTRQWRELPIRQPDECYSSWASVLERLPNGNLGFLYECNSKDLASNAITLYMWDGRTGQFQALQRFTTITAAPYTYSPDMSELIQEDATGGGLSNRLYRVSTSGAMEELFPDWQRISMPSWSPDGTRITFVATKDYPGNVFGPIRFFAQIASLALYPWDLYVMDADGHNPRIVLPKVQAGRPRWLPEENLLTFPGQYGRTEGIWVLNLETHAVTQIWPQSDIYEFSPDGKRAVVLEHVGPPEDKYARPIIVALPPALLTADQN